MQVEVMGQIVAVCVVETPLTLQASCPTHFHTFILRLQCICVCTWLLHVSVHLSFIKKSEKHILQVCFPVLPVTAYMPRCTTQLSFVIFVVQQPSAAKLDLFLLLVDSIFPSALID